MLLAHAGAMRRLTWCLADSWSSWLRLADSASFSNPFLQEDFEGIVKDWEGFEFKAERPKEESFVMQKWGWTSNTPGEACFRRQVLFALGSLPLAAAS